MNGITKPKSTKLLSALLAVLMIVAMLPTTAFAWSVEEGTKCTSTYGDLYLGSDGNNYYSKAGNTLFYNDDGMPTGILTQKRTGTMKELSQR